MGIARKKRAQPAEDTEAVTLRREKNRQAQHVFRKRKQATEAAQVQRIRRLEEVVEEMSQVVMRVFDAVFETEALTTRHPALVSCLDGALARVLELAREVVSSEEDQQQPPQPSIQDVSSSSSMIEDVSQGYLPPTLEEVPSFPEFLVPDETNVFTTDDGVYADYNLSYLPSNTTDWHATPLPPQIFGNGLLARTDFGPHDDHGPLYPLPTLEFQARLNELGSFTSRLTEGIVSYGYACLINSPAVPTAIATAEVQRAFGYTLRHRTREQMIENLQWLLGPGRAYMYRASGFTWGEKGGTSAVFPKKFASRDGKQPKMRELIPEDRVPEGREEEEGDFLTALGVQEELKGLGARMVDGDMMEIRIRDTESSPAALKGTGLDRWADTSTTSYGVGGPAGKGTGGPPPSPVFGGMFGFLLRHRQERHLTLRLNMTLLIANLSRHSVCFVRGPGFPRHELGQMVQASVVTAHWS